MKKYYKSDFDFLLDLVGCNGGKLGWPQWDWSVILWTVSRANAVRVGVRDGVPYGCFNDNGRIHVVMKNHRLGPGVLKGEITQSLPDDIYPGGIRLEVSPETMGIELTLGKGDCPTEAEVEAVLPVIKGEKGDKGDKGEQGEKGEKGDGFTDLQIHKLDGLPTAETLSDELSAKQNKLTTSDDLQLTDDRLSLTELAKKRLFIDQWNNICKTDGRYNEDTGFFELNGILDLSYTDAMTIMENSPMLFRLAGNYLPTAAFSLSAIRTTFPLRTYGNGLGAGKFDQTFKYCEKLEVARIYGGAQVNLITCFFSNNAAGAPSKLREIVVTADKVFLSGTNEFPATLQILKISKLFSDLSIPKCSKLGYDSLEYILKGCNTGLTITVHKDIYAKLTADTTNAAAAALSQEELARWMALGDLAESKNITLATV